MSDVGESYDLAAQRRTMSMVCSYLSDGIMPHLAHQDVFEVTKPAEQCQL